MSVATKYNEGEQPNQQKRSIATTQVILETPDACILGGIPVQ